ncbi:5-formyltetrahydrofolate cyclo-ligase [Leuconostoc suionicum]|uniref:5-formyltetrahydrofolate cyclo-ligase n=1 Tax=Leuconostoc suionicum TaxID=1511761 RepID=UPI003C33F8D5
MLSKKEIRKMTLDKLKLYDYHSKITEEERLQAILFSKAYWNNSNSVAVTISMEHELSTDVIIQEALRSHKKVVVPRVSSGKLLWFDYIESLMSKSKFGILEPTQDKNQAQNLKGIDLMVVPGVAFSEDNYRIGYGAGFFDATLAEYNGITVSLVLPPQSIHKFSKDTWDRPVRYLIK